MIPIRVYQKILVFYFTPNIHLAVINSVIIRFNFVTFKHFRVIIIISFVMYKFFMYKIGLFCINFKIMDFVTEPVDPHSELGYALCLMPYALTMMGHKAEFCYGFRSTAQNFLMRYGQRWASTTVFISVISNIDTSYIFPYRKKDRLNLSFRYRKSPDINIRFHSDINIDHSNILCLSEMG